MGVHYNKADFITYGKPSLFLDFANKKSLVDRISGNNLITFTRTSTGTYVGADGSIKTASANEARFDHNPTTGESLGLLIEEQRTNFIQESVPSASVDSYWLKRNLTNSQNIVRGPNMLGIDIVPTSSTYSNVYMSYAWAGIETSQTYTNWTGPGVSIIPYRVSFLINPLTWTGNIFLQSQTYDGNPAFGSRITLFSGGNYVADSSFIKAIYSDGTYWIHNIYKPGNTGTSFKLGFTVDEQGNDSKKYWVSSIQMESGPQSTPAGTTPDPTFSTSYIPTSGSQVTRTADTASITGTNFSSWYNYSQSTVLIQGSRLGGTSDRLIELAGSSGENRIWANNDWYTSSYQSGETANNLQGITIPIGGFYKYSYGFEYNGSNTIKSAVRNGLNLVTSTTANRSIPNPADGTVSLNFVGLGINSKIISRFTYYPTRLTDTQLQNLTR